MARRRSGRSMLAAVVWAVTLGTPPAGASGGGGCGAPVTDGSGTSVAIDQFCFSPTILRTDEGAVVTFENRDPTTHNVLGAHAAWGSWDSMRGGRELSFRFAEAGVFPYVCAWHPGMVGVVVVGDGSGGAIDTTTKDGPVTQVSAKDLARLEAAPVAATRREDPEVWPVLLAIGIGVGVVATFGRILRSRRRSVA